MKNNGVIFLGDKGQGKTTSWLVLCQSQDFSFVSNDHIILSRDNFTISGVPTSIGIRRTLMDKIPALASYLNHGNKNNYLFQSQTSNHKKVYFLVRDLLNILKNKPSVEVPLRLIVFPCYDAMIKYVDVRPLKLAEIVDNIDELIITSPCEQVPLWQEYLNGPSNVNVLKQEFIKLVGSLPCYQISYNDQLFAQFSEEIKRLLGNVNNRYLVDKAQEFIKVKHKDVLRKDGRQILEHLEAVSDLTSKYYGPNDYLKSLALLHDILEESSTQIDEIINNFGERLGCDILSLTSIKKVGESYDAQIKRMKESLMRSSAEVLMVKSVDRLHNVENMLNSANFFSAEKISRYLKTTREILAEIISPRIDCQRILDDFFCLVDKKK